MREMCPHVQCFMVIMQNTDPISGGRDWPSKLKSKGSKLGD